MEKYNYNYSSKYQGQPDAPYQIPDHGDGFGEYYDPRVLNDDARKRPSCSKYRSRKHERRSRSRGSEKSRSYSRSRSRSKSRSRSRSRSHSTKSRSRSRSKSRSQSRTRSGSPSYSRDHQRRELVYKDTSLLDAFRIMYLTPSKQSKSTTKYLVVKKKEDRVHELLKKDGLGSKHWFFYPRNNQVPESREPAVSSVPGTRDNIDQRVKVDSVFFRKYKKSRKVDMNAPAAKLKRLELILYKNLGFVQAI